MLFEQSPKIYKRLSQGLSVLAVVGVLRFGSEILKKEGYPKYWVFPTLASTVLASISHYQYRSLKNQGDQNDSK